MKKKKLKIAVFHLAFIYSGGGEKLVLKEAEGLKKLGHRVDIYTCVVDKKKCFPDLTKGVFITEFLPWAGGLLKGHEAFQVVLSCLLAPFFIYQFRDYDVIFAANQPSLWISYIAKLILSKKYVGYLAQPTRFLYPREIDRETGLYFGKKESMSLSVKLMTFFKNLIKRLDLLSIQGADAVLVNGKYMTNMIKKIYHVDARNCPAGASYISQPVSIKSKKAGRMILNRNVIDKPYLLMTNRHAWQKRFEYGLNAFSGLLAQDYNYNLVISGSLTEYTEELKVEVERLGLTDKVIFVGLLKDSDLTKLYKNAVCYLYTAPQEDFGMGVIEAMGSGIPVIAWNSGGPSKTVVNGKTGFLIQPNDIENFTKKVIYIARNSKKSHEMGKRSILSVKSNYSWKKHTFLLEDSLQNLLN